MTMFHVNTITNTVDKCAAVDECVFGSANLHFTSMAAARNAFKLSQKAVIKPVLRLNLTKADARKLVFKPSLLFKVAEKDAKIVQEVTDFYELLGRVSYTVADKADTVATIYGFMDKLYAKRSKKGAAGVYARAAYNHIAEELDKFGFTRKPYDKGDELIKATFPEDFKSINPRISELQTDVAHYEMFVELCDRPLIDWSDQEITDYSDLVSKSEYYSTRSYYGNTAFKALHTGRKALRDTLKRERVIAIWDALPFEVQDLLPKALLESEIVDFEAIEPRPHLTPGKGARTNSCASSISQAKGKAIVKLKLLKDQIALTKMYEVLLLKLDNLS